MKLFTCGPVEMYPSTAVIRSKGFVHFRTNEYSEIVKNTLSKISALLGNSEENSLIYMAASGTAAMEAAVDNCVFPSEKVLVINGGGFGKRFCEMLEYHNRAFDSINLKWNEALTANHLQPYENKNYSALFVNMHETTSGQLYNMQMLSDFCKRNNMMFIVDAISSFLADEYDMEKFGVDLTIISSQKGLCCSPGMSLVSFSKRMKEKVLNNTNKISSVYFDFKDYLNNIWRGQTPYTPPVLVMYELQDMMNIIEKEGGLEGRLLNVKSKCEYFRRKAKEYGLTIPDYPVSNMLTPVYIKDANAYDVIQVLKDKYRIFINPCGGELADKLVRVSHIGNTTIEDIDDLVEKLMLSIKEVKDRELVYDRK